MRSVSVFSVETKNIRDMKGEVCVCGDRSKVQKRAKSMNVQPLLWD